MKRRTFIKTAIGVASGALLHARTVNSQQGPDPAPAMVDLNRFSANSRQETGFVIGVLDDPLFAGRECPKGLDLRAFQSSWGSTPNIRIIPLNKYEIRSFSVVFRGHLDVLVYPYGPLYPMDAFDIYTGDTISGFLKRGGAVLTTGGVPFGAPVSDDGKCAKEGRPDPFSLNPEIYSRWVAPLGYKYYVHPYPPPMTGINRPFLPDLPTPFNLPGTQLGLVVNNSSHLPVPDPYHGNVFPERYPARSVTPLFWGEDAYGQILATNGVLVQDFENGSRRLHLTHDQRQHPLAPASNFFDLLMNNLLCLLTNRIFVRDVETNYACYRAGEAVIVHAHFVSFEAFEVEAEVVLEIKAGDDVVDTHRETVRFPQGQQVLKEWTWSPNIFEDDEYTVSVSVVSGRQSLSLGQNGFVVWKDEVVRRGPTLSAAGTYFRNNGGGIFLTGTNYYESTRGEIMWFRPDVSRICNDLRKMRYCGVNYIRPHYHHLKWFKDYLEFQHERLLPYFETLAAVRTPFPDERTWRMLDVFIYLCQKHGIIYGGDLFTLVPEEMGDPRGWFPLLDAVTYEEKREVAKQFFMAVNERYKDAPGIAWDLWNEPVVPLPLLKQWTAELRETLRPFRGRRMITVGGGSGEALGSSVDFLGLHLGVHKIRDAAGDLDKPAIAQEVYLDHLEDLTSELSQAEDMREGMFAAVYSGLAGFAPWSWTRQMRLWQDSYSHDPEFRMESWDDRLGTQVHDDGTVKPAGQVFRDIALILRSIQFISFDRQGHLSRTSVGQVKVTLPSKDGPGGYSIVHFSDSHCFAGISLGMLSWQGRDIASGPADAYVYVLGNGEDIVAAKQLLLKSEKPGVLKLFSRSTPRSIKLVDPYWDKIRTVDELKWNISDTTIEITTQPTQQAYWIAAEW
ncbi:MAG: hypothetical protein WB341_13095 [Terracidiphilus sp.]